MAKRLICFAHRGASGHAPENTLAAFEKAVALGADGIELDVYAVEDRLLVIHDERLERTTNGTGRVLGRSLDYLRSLDAGRGDGIPFLNEVLDVINRRVFVNIELKGPDTARPVVTLIKRFVQTCGWHYDDFLVSSFQPHQVKTAGNLCPCLPRALNMKKLVPGSLNSSFFRDLFSIHIDLRFASADSIREIHEADCRALVFTANAPEEIRRVAIMGADGVFTDFPERVRNWEKEENTGDCQ